LSLGSNQGDRIYYLQKSIESIQEQIGNIELVSSYYETEPWGFQTSNSFINQVICLKTSLLPEKLLDKILDIETQLGRKRKLNSQIYENRIIDIDILFYNDQVINGIELMIPHKDIHLRRFILEPLFEIEPELVHPTIKLTIRELLLICPDKMKVEKYKTSEIML
jgi:2-amino-4-hydroxy-6-hydroxymethyldihydropteridine diphosphokinase